ncbi:GerMN domain-containing protein [Georgenia sp. EYE_87]|uniref:Gmad2 immunoglobulin-like domain-containing protein n=1 Tax=Georgenia sp. EYE_87 TaxID=2853448 RepID=UPI002003C9F0|nr:Gmad2 immunoglobulin-like domain-containing protein [Georgenia sp. EYE_87]MCK6210304.1 GerMN domain-containing protein [Georgenia sp. EYE_87]
MTLLPTRALPGPGHPHRPGSGWRTSSVSAVAALVLVTGCGDGPTPAPDPGTTAPPTTEPAPTAAPTATPAPTATSEAPTPSEVAVYYLVDTRAGFRLARELREVTGDPLVGAVEAMIEGPTDPDYATTWNSDTEVLSVEQGPGTITVDLSEDARTANAGSEAAALMVQQLVHTVVEAAGEDASVQLLIDGEPAGELWGVLTWDEPVAPENPVDVRVLVQIDRPVEGAEVTSPVTVSGEANAFEANVPWRVLRPDGTEVTDGFTMTTAGQEFAPFSFEVELEPGTYVVEISEDDPSGGEGGTPMTDTRTFTVE